MVARARTVFSCMFMGSLQGLGRQSLDPRPPLILTPVVGHFMARMPEPASGRIRIALAGWAKPPALSIFERILAGIDARVCSRPGANRAVMPTIRWFSRVLRPLLPSGRMCAHETPNIFKRRWSVGRSPVPRGACRVLRRGAEEQAFCPSLLRTLSNLFFALGIGYRVRRRLGNASNP